MLTLNFQIQIHSNIDLVWKVITQLEYYQLWAQAFSPDPVFQGSWLEGEEVIFFDPSLGGTKAIIDNIEPGKLVEYHHVAIFNPEHIQDIDSDVAKKWIGCKEKLELDQDGENVLLSVTVETHPDFSSMFNNSWNAALPAIKLLAEQEKA
ncbi:SRPBCC domain-containing protein [Vibrio sp. S4M6]|uniref:SRPBCC domain-containing protein n=1 Tax=Vibrio sinus TaxID=2946865 RepID=UPI002029BD98|nr:SRPBCC domain-containing protein [Vibrio sinus]MCL9779991.1 SRPBCC domain-containing protein [Vibrio sinus]